MMFQKLARMFMLMRFIGFLFFLLAFTMLYIGVFPLFVAYIILGIISYFGSWFVKKRIMLLYSQSPPEEDDSSQE